MRAFVIAPADMQTDAVLRQALQGVLQSGHMGGGDFQKLIIRQMGEQHMPRQGQIGAIQLQIQPCL